MFQLLFFIPTARADGIVNMPSASQLIASSSEVANPVFQGFWPIAVWIVGALLGVAFILLVIFIGELVLHAVGNLRHHN